MLLENILSFTAEHDDFVRRPLNGNVKSSGCSHSAISAKYGYLLGFLHEYPHPP
jgi:hypothetical protein